MKPEFTFLPEFKPFGSKTETSPEIRFKNFFFREFFLKGKISIFKMILAGDYRTLLTGPGRYLIFSWSGFEIGYGIVQ